MSEDKNNQNPAASQKPAASPKSPKKVARADALRANLQKRKAQSRARESNDEEK